MNEKIEQASAGVASVLNAELDTFKTPYDRGIIVTGKQIGRAHV